MLFLSSSHLGVIIALIHDLFDSCNDSLVHANQPVNKMFRSTAEEEGKRVFGSIKITLSPSTPPTPHQ